LTVLRLPAGDQQRASLNLRNMTALTDQNVCPNGLVTHQLTGLIVLLSSIASSPPSAPRLELFQLGSDEVQRVIIDHSPFKIGRCETSDLRIDSVEVSREHAQISRRGNIWVIRDLGSTNGTKVNGKSVRESFLSDGDLIAIAETEVTFVAASVTPIQRMATQPIQSRESTKPPALLPSEITQMRALTEATLCQAIPLQLKTAISFNSGEAEACFAQFCETAIRIDPDFIAFHAVGKYYRELARHRAIEITQAQTKAHRIFLAVDVVEFESPQQLLSNIEQLRIRNPLDGELGITISLSKVLEPKVFDNVCREVRKADLLLGFVDFQGSGGQVLELEASTPDYLVLSDVMLRGAISSSQPLSRLELVLKTCEQLGIKPVLPQCTCQGTIDKCRQIGYEFILQSTTPVEKAVRDNLLALTS
jgi:pSer/pThr/pTyr-binding forkhead associated (FHA) protein